MRNIVLDEMINPEALNYPPEPTVFTMQFTGSPVATATSVSDWNAYLLFRDNSNQVKDFDSVVWNSGTNTVTLIGYQGDAINIKNTSGLNSETKLLDIDDSVNGLLNIIFNSGLAGTSGLTGINSGGLTEIKNSGIANSAIQIITAPNNDTKLGILGATSGDDGVFLNLLSGVLFLTCLSTLSTNDGGSPDGDIVYVTTNYPASVITYV